MVILLGLHTIGFHWGYFHLQIFREKVLWTVSIWSLGYRQSTKLSWMFNPWKHNLHIDLRQKDSELNYLNVTIATIFTRSQVIIEDMAWSTIKDCEVHAYTGGLSLLENIVHKLLGPDAVWTLFLIKCWGIPAGNLATNPICFHPTLGQLIIQDKQQLVTQWKKK